jgi:hypothetical protein
MMSVLLQQAGLGDAEKPSISRLSGLGLVTESLKMRDFDPSIPALPTSQSSLNRYPQVLKELFRRYFQHPPAREYGVSVFGRRFLDFVTSANQSATEEREA